MRRHDPPAPLALPLFMAPADAAHRALLAERGLLTVKLKMLKAKKPHSGQQLRTEGRIQELTLRLLRLETGRGA